MQSLWPLIEFGNIITSQKGEVIEQGCDLCTHSLDFLESLDFQSFMFLFKLGFRLGKYRFLKHMEF